MLPHTVNKVYFCLAPMIAMVPGLITVAVVPWGSNLVIGGQTIKGVIADLNVGILFVFAIASLGVYGIVLAGWASNSKYPFLGGIRSSAQMISYEVCLGPERGAGVHAGRLAQSQPGGRIPGQAIIG